MIHEHYAEIARRRLGPTYRVSEVGLIFLTDHGLGRVMDEDHIEVYNREFAEYCEAKGFKHVYIVPAGKWDYNGD